MATWRAILLIFLWSAVVFATEYSDNSKTEDPDGSQVSGRRLQRVRVSEKRMLYSILPFFKKINCIGKPRCTNDMNCPKTQFCKNRNIIFLRSCCENRKSNGQLCSRNRECAGGFCSTGRCGECISDSNCPSGKFCRYRNIPGAIKKCKNKLPNLRLCDRNTMCASGKCVNFICCSKCLPQIIAMNNECTDDKDCPSGKYCKYRNVPVIRNRCADKKKLGSLCSRKEECVDGFCAVGRCSQCIDDGDCPSGRYCKNRNVPLFTKRCTPKKSLGSLCSRKEECASGFCAGKRCSQCRNDGDCPSGTYCKNQNLPLFTKRCTPKKCRGTCSRNAMCKSGKCRVIRFCKRC